MNSSALRGVGMTSARTRERMVATVRDCGIHEKRVLNALRAIPRHLFVEEALAHRAYENRPLSIGYGQTISQPFIVALMSQAAMEIEPKSVLEIGTGSGYQAAVLSMLVDSVYSVERIEPLERRTRALFAELGVENVRQKLDDGHEGWEEHAPYDAIVVTAAAASVPQALKEQLRDGGRMVIPVAGSSISQNLLVVDRRGRRWHTRHVADVVFVPMREGVQA